MIILQFRNNKNKIMATNNFYIFVFKIPSKYVET